MEQSPTPPNVVRFGVFEVDLANAELRKQGLKLRLQEQPYQILAALLERPGEVVTREDLCRRLWADGTNVDFDRGLNAAVTRLRQVLSDSAETPKYVETVARRGYRFISPVESHSEAEPPRRRARIWPVLAAVVVITVVAITIVGAVWWSFHHRQASPTSQQLRVVPLTTDPGSEEAPSFSPDGNQVAYTWDKGDGQPHIFIKLVGPGDPMQLTSGPGAEYSPAWSRDGRWIAFVRQLDVSKIGVFVVPSLGGVARKLTEFSVFGGGRRAGIHLWYRHSRIIDWTPDGGHLIVSGAENPDQESSLFVIPMDGSERQRLTIFEDSTRQGGQDPAVSPDGLNIAFAVGASAAPSEIYLLPLSRDLQQAGAPRRLTALKANSVNPAWTRDGAEIIFTSDAGGGYRLWRIGTAAASQPQVLAGAGSEGFFPATGPRGRLAYTRIQDDVNIWRQELLTRPGAITPAVSLISSTEIDRNAQYSPDGARIAFQSSRSGNLEIWTCASDGTQCAQLTNINGPHTGSPRWSPDGRQIAFDSAAEGNYNIYVVGANGGRPRRLTAGAALNAIPCWSRDGKWIYFASNRTGRQEIWKLPGDGGEAIQVTRGGGRRVVESPDKRSLYYTKEDGATTLWSSNPDGSGEREVLKHIIARCFDVTSDRIYFLQPEAGGGATLRALEIATGRQFLIASIPRLPSQGLSVSPDGRHAIYSQIDRYGGDLMFVENFR